MTATKGYAQLPNALVERGILAHIRPQALKVYQAILHAARSKATTCWPGVKTLARWSGIPRSRVPGETAYLEQHRLISKGWVKINGNPRRTYRVTQPTDPMYPDYRESCSLCMITDRRKSCLVRDKATGRLRGRRSVTAKAPSQSGAPDHRDPGSPDHRDSPMITDHRDTKQTEADEKVRSRRGGGVGEPDGAARCATQRKGVAPLAARLSATDPDAVRRTELQKVRQILAENSADHVAVAVQRTGRCEATTGAGLACVGRPVIGSAFCKRHQKLRDTECAPVA